MFVFISGVQEVRYDDVELGSLDVAEPETWSETVDKKVLKKMNMKDVKRQDTIWGILLVLWIISVFYIIVFTVQCK